MKKFLFALLVMALVGGAVFLFRPKPAMSENRSPSSQTKGTAATVSPSNTSTVTPVQPVATPATNVTLRDSDAFRKLRAAIAAGDQASASQALDELTAFVKAHPELVDEYVATLRSEKNEFVLRYLALALAESEPILRDEKIAKAAMDLAKDTSFQQRQHIALHLMSSFPEMRADVHQTVLDLTRQDPDSQVKTSAVAVMADWLQTFHGETQATLIGELEQIFKNARDEDVRAFTYQLAALHKDQLSLSFQNALVERLKTEPDWTGRNLIIAALTGASAEIRAPILAQVQSALNNEKDLENKRHLLAQYVVLAQEHSTDILQKNTAADSPLAEDAKAYLALLAAGTVNPDNVFGQKATLDAQRHPPAEVKH